MSISRIQSTAEVQSSNMRRLLFIATAVTLVISLLPGEFSSYIIYPIRLFVTLVHETGHAVAATLVGGRVDYIQVHPNGEGITWAATPNWAQWVYLSGGYIGSVLFGAGLLQLVRFIGWKTALNLLGVFVASTTLLWAHDPIHNLFTLCVGILLSTALFAAARFLKRDAAGFVVMFLAVQCCLNAVGDLKILLYLTTNTNADNDAVFMSKIYLLPPTFWALLWGVCSIAILSGSLYIYFKAISKRAVSA